jgi:hypothetical protein
LANVEISFDDVNRFKTHSDLLIPSVQKEKKIEFYFFKFASVVEATILHRLDFIKEPH